MKTKALLSKVEIVKKIVIISYPDCGVPLNDGQAASSPLFLYFTSQHQITIATLSASQLGPCISLRTSHLPELYQSMALYIIQAFIHLVFISIHLLSIFFLLTCAVAAVTL